MRWLSVKQSDVKQSDVILLHTVRKSVTLFVKW